MGKPYSAELDLLASTFAWAERQSVTNLGHFLTRWSGDHVAVVGSGGSYSAAFVVALLRELVHHSPTSAVTPLEFDAMLRRLSPRALLLSAEGKNRDILATAKAAQASDLASAALTLTQDNPLLDFAKQHASLRAFPFRMDWIKDGYLATNSLIATVLLAYRALCGDDDFKGSLATFFGADRLAARRASVSTLVDAAQVRRRGLLVLYSVQTKSFAIDIESRLSESALAMVQLADLRQFAHGRHLQLASDETAPCVLIVSSSEEGPLATEIARHLPSNIARWHIEVEGSNERDIAVTSLLDAMFLAEGLARGAAHDPGNPDVPMFGRDIHAIDYAAILHPSRGQRSRLELAAARKAQAGAHGKPGVTPAIVEAASRYARRLEGARIKGMVCDFDGTLCRAEDRFGHMPPEQAEQISSLIEQGMKFAIATGRGGSLHEALREAFDLKLHASILVGYYGGSVIARLDQDFVQPDPRESFRELCSWLESSVYGSDCKPFEKVVRAGQLSMRIGSTAKCIRLQAAVRNWLDGNDRRDWRVFCSGHSIDVLDAETSKSFVVQHVASVWGVDPLTEVLRIGDSGHEGGNDYELLRDGLSLSCDRVSVDLNACWNFGASGSNQSDVTMSYLRGLLRRDTGFAFAGEALFHD